MAALMKKSTVIENAESRVTCGSCRTCQPSSLTSTLRVNKTTEAIVVPTIPAIRSRGLPLSGMLGTNPAASSRKSGSTVPAVKKKAKPITPTREARTLRKNACLPTQYRDSSNTVKPTAAPSGSIEIPRAFALHSRRTSTTIAITPMIDVSWVAASETTISTVTGIPKCRRKRCSRVSPEMIVRRLMPTIIRCVNIEASASVQVKDMP